LDRVPESLYPDIIANTAQIEEWKRLFAIDEIKADTVTLPYTQPLTVEFLKGNPFLVLDTQFFGREWKYKLLASIENIDEQCDGLLINSENFQALNLIKTRYRETVKAIFIDPPYNTENDRQTGKFIYKDGFTDSSWISMMYDRVKVSYSFLANNGLFFCTIDDNELYNLKLICDNIFNPTNFKANIIWNSRKSKQNDIDVSLSHNYIILYSKNKSKMELYGQPLNESEFDNPDNDKKGKWKISPMDAPGVRERTSFYPIINPISKEEFYPPKGRHWTVFEEDVAGLIDEGRIFFGLKGNTKPQWKRYWEEVKQDSKSIGTIWDELDTATNATKELENIIGHKNFETPKPTSLMDEITQQSIYSNEVIIDYFSGSGTTAHAIIKRNIQNPRAKYILCEMGNYFDQITKTRVLKIIYSEDWKDGKPVSRKGSSHCFKYLRLESYEDTLNNLQLQRSQTQQSLLADPDFGEEYLLHYMLNVESRESLLNLELFKRPFGYTLKVTENNALQPQEVDLVETFNYLIGLVVETTQIIKGNVVIEGRNLQGDKILVIWRDVEQTGNAALNEFFKKLNINTKDSEFKRIYVNGDNNLENLRTDGEQWKVVLIEEEFHKRMFDVKDV
ncbi:MAG TPA: site-specific DNA-methyltransferase, partial [Lentimicrobium sp.]|nr:site-specific DNA-methyltransferase [Lentimicrobium sp.]